METKVPQISPAPLDARSKLLRQQIVNVLKFSRRGHVGASFSLV